MDWQNNFKDIIKQAQKGNEEAFSQIIQNTQKKFFGFCMYLCGDMHLAQDVCQDVYIKAIEHLKDFENETKLYNWLFKTAKNHYIDFTRNHQNKPYIDLEDISDDEGNASETCEGKLELIEILQKIDPKYRIALILVDSEGYTYREASEIIGLTEDALRSRLHKARKFFIENIKK
ncbi:MAG: hypothetical protein A2202_05030 [Bdellovibrionales bacterium RIFOXYA1_FULL_36_14]|nr:MAG: hypothetical protein A2202_05030 [Bdellovibrionales bacterium RIFOXYA1_FULL_36_14]